MSHLSTEISGPLISILNCRWPFSLTRMSAELPVALIPIRGEWWALFIINTSGMRTRISWYLPRDVRVDRFHTQTFTAPYVFVLPSLLYIYIIFFLLSMALSWNLCMRKTCYSFWINFFFSLNNFLFYFCIRIPSSRKLSHQKKNGFILNATRCILSYT